MLSMLQSGVLLSEKSQSHALTFETFLYPHPVWKATLEGHRLAQVSLWETSRQYMPQL